jgi:hypothetical protein
VIQRLFLDGINAKTTGAAVGGQDDLVVPVGSNETEAPLPFAKPAKPGAQVALNTPIGQFMPVLG